MLPLKQADVKNRILAGLPSADFTMLRVKLERLTMSSGDLLQGAAEPAKTVYFVETGIVSLLAPLKHGGRIEIGHVGSEGAAGVHAALGARTLTSDIMAQSDGVVWRIGALNLRNFAERSRPLRQSLAGFANTLHAQVAQTAACNGTHDVSQRLARWLLMVHDRTQGDVLDLTHEMISIMLGVTRPGVTIAAGTLQKAGLIRYARGRLTIADRAGLESVACECYAIVKDYYRSESR